MSYQLTPGRDATEYVIQTGYNDYPENGSEKHTASGSRTNRPVTDLARAGGKYQGDQTSNESERCHQDGSEPYGGTLNGSSSYGEALFLFLCGKLHDQYCIFTQQADQHYHCHLRINIVLQPYHFQP